MLVPPVINIQSPQRAHGSGQVAVGYRTNRRNAHRIGLIRKVQLCTNLSVTLLKGTNHHKFGQPNPPPTCPINLK